MSGADEHKVHRERLAMRNPYVAPRTSTEQELAHIWCTVLNMDRVGMDDHYIDLGVDSFLAVIMFEYIAQKLTVTIPMARLISVPTIAMLACDIDSQKQGSHPNILQT